jgi:ubiquitin C-terminal hydrolase
MECKERYEVPDYSRYWELNNYRPFSYDKNLLDYENIIQSIAKAESTKKNEKPVKAISTEEQKEESINNPLLEVIGNVIKIKLGGLVMQPMLQQNKEPSLVVSTGKRYNGKPSGLQNTCNICYMNSSIQCLKCTSELFNYFADHDLNTEIGEEFARLLRALNASGTCVSPLKFKKCIDRYTTQFPLYKQCDAHEFLTFLIDRLHDETVKKHINVIDELFYGEFTSRIQCTNCSNTSVTNEPFMCISLPIDGVVEELPVLLQTSKHNFIYLSFKFDELEMTIGKLKIEMQKAFLLNGVSIYLLVNNELEVASDTLSMGQIMSSGKSWKLYAIEKSETKEMLIRLDLGKPNPPLFLKYPRELIDNEPELRKILKKLADSHEYESIQNNFSLIKGMMHTTQKGLSYLRMELKPLCRNSFFSNILERLPYKELKLTHTKTNPEDYETLEGCFKSFTSVEKLRGSSKSTCEHCHKLVEFNKKVDYLTLPQVLMVHLKRFKVRSKNSRVKISKLVRFPMKLELEKADHKVEKYRLYGVINHMGDIERGHYTAYCKSSTWTQFDDNKVSPLEESKVVTENAYVLFYENSNS